MEEEQGCREAAIKTRTRIGSSTRLLSASPIPTFFCILPSSLSRLRGRQDLGLCVCVSCSIVSDSLQPHDRSLPGASIHGILQSRILEWVTISFSRGSSWPMDQSSISCITRRFFTIWATREVLHLAKLDHCEERDIFLISKLKIPKKVLWLLLRFIIPTKTMWL